MSRVLPILFNTEMVRVTLDGRKTVTRRKVDIDIANQFDIEHDGKTVVAYIDQATGDSYNPTEICRYQPGDIIYVREAFCPNYFDETLAGYRGDGLRGNKNAYMADYRKEIVGDTVPEPKWKPSIHMPKEAARIWLEVTDVRAERLQNITEEQAIREGVVRLYDDLPDAEYIDWAKRTGVFPKAKEDYGYKNYLWHGNFGACGTGNKMSDAWEYQYSSYDSARDSFSSLWNTTVPLKEWDTYGWDANPWVWVIEFEQCDKP